MNAFYQFRKADAKTNLIPIIATGGFHALAKVLLYMKPALMTF
jgi:hypothetical protein